MILLLMLALLGFAGSYAIARNPIYSVASKAIWLRFASVGLAVLAFVSSMIIQVDAGQAGVVSLFGKVETEVLTSGLHLVNPLAEVIKYDITTQNYTMSAVADEGEKNGDDAIKVLSADGLEVSIDLTVLYKVNPTDAPRIHREVGVFYTDKLVRPLARTRIRDNAVYYDAIALFSTKRDEFQNRIQRSIEADFAKRGIVLEQLLVRNINLPSSVKKKIEDKINAEQESQKMQFVLSKERQEAERKRVEAQGIADYQKILQEGLTERQLAYERIKVQRDIAMSPNTKIIIMDGKSAPIIIDGK